MDRRGFLNKLGSFAVLGAMFPIMQKMFTNKELIPYRKPVKNNKADMGNCIFYIDTDHSFYVNSNAYLNKNGAWELRK